MGIRDWLRGGERNDGEQRDKESSDEERGTDVAPRSLIERLEDLEQQMAEVATEEHIDVTALDKRVGLLEGRIPDEAWFREQLKASAIEEKVDHTLVKQAIQKEHDTLTDQMAHIEERLNGLESAAEQFQTLKIEDLVRSSDMEQRIEGLRDELEDRSWIEQRLESLEIAEASDISAMQARVDELETTISRGDSGDLQAEIDELRGAVADMQAAQKELEPVRDAVEAHEQVNKRVDAVMDAATMLDERLANLAEIVELRGQKIDRVSTDEKQTKDEVNELEHALEAFEQRLKHIDEELSTLENEEPDVRKEDLLEVEHRLDNLQSAITKLQESAEEHALESEIDDLKEDLLKLSDLVLKLLDRRKPADTEKDEDA